MILTLLCLAFNPLAPNLYAQEMQRIEQVREILNEQQKEVKKETKIVKKQIKKIETVQNIILPAELPKSGIFDTDSLYTDNIEEYKPVEVINDSTYRKNRIYYRCDVHGISNSTCNTAVKIAKAESGYNPYAKYGYGSNPNKVDENICVKLAGGSCSSASGLFQFVSKTWHANAKRFGFEGASRYDGDINIQVALLKMHHDGFSAWNASSHAW